MKRPADFPKRQHFVPEMMQKRFVDRDGRLWFHDKRRSAREIASTRPGNLFVEGHLYTVEDAAGTRSAEVETRLSELESVTDPILDQLVAAARRRQPPCLDRAAISVLMEFMHFQYRRTPDFIRSVTLPASPRKMVEQSIAKWEAATGRAIAEAHRERLLSEPEVQRRMKANRMAVLSTPSETVLGVLAKRGVVVAGIGRPNRSFILGSFPFARTQVDGNRDLRDPRVELWMPIAPDVAVGLVGEKGRQDFLAVDAEHLVRNFNRNIWSLSTTIASPSPDLLRSVVARR